MEYSKGIAAGCQGKYEICCGVFGLAVDYLAYVSNKGLTPVFL